MSNCKVIALTNQKGGVGKTTTAVNLGVSLVQQGKKVLLIDADAQANLTMALGYNRPDDIPITLSTVMQNIIDDKTLDASQGIIHHREGVDLLPSNIELSGFEVRLINAMSRERVLKTYVNEVKKNYDYVLIDCMPSLGMITINALAAADSVIIPTQPHYLSAKGLELLLRSVSMVKRQINPKLRIDGILMTMVMPRTNISKEITATVKSAYGKKIKVFDTEIPHSIRAVEATAEGKSIFAYDKSGIDQPSMYTNKHAWTNKDGTYKEVYYYICGRNKQERGHHCDYKASLRKTDIEPLVIEAVKELVSDKYFAKEIEKRIGVQTDTTAIDKELANYESKLKEVDLNKARLEREIDNLPIDARFRERKIHDMTLRLDALYDTIVELEERIEDAKLRKSSIEMETITLDNIYKLMLNFGKLYDIISDEEKKSLITYLIKEIQIYPNGESEQPLKSIEFNFPIYRDGQEVRRLLWEKGNTVETVVGLQRKDT